MISLIAVVAIAALAAVFLLIQGRRLRRRPRLLGEIMDEADALERELHECRNRLREIPALVTTLPPASQLSARATLVAEPQVQAGPARPAFASALVARARRDRDARRARIGACALAGAKAALATQLERLASVRSDLEAARAAQTPRADVHP